MSRTKTYNTKEVIGYLNEYRIENPGLKISIPKFGTYIAAKATEAIHEKDVCLEKMKKSEAETAKLKEQLKKMEEKQEATKVNDSELKKKDEIITALKSIIDDYIYPNAANAILRKEGILQIENNIIDDEVIDKQMMDANTSIDDDNTEEAEKRDTKSKYASVDSLLGGFDD